LSVVAAACILTAPSMQSKQAAAPDPCTQSWACTQSRCPWLLLLA
jgi:hypothetical protein